MIQRIKRQRSSESEPQRRSRFEAAALTAVCAWVAIGLGIGGCAGGGEVEFKGESAWSYLVAQCDFGPRPPGTAAHDSTVRFITGHLQRRGAKVTLQRFERDDPYADRTLRFVNVVGSFSPNEKKRVLLAAHFDTRPWADQEKADSLQGRPIIGANDGASGVAVLMELADLLSEKTPRGLGVDLVFFDGEDYGKEGDLEHYLIGSKYFAANLRTYRPVCGILLDMVGGTGAEIYQEGNSFSRARELTEELFRRADELGLDVFVPRRVQPIYDDHVPLLMAGIPTVDLIGLPYPYWHTLGDTPDKCSTETLRQVGVLLVDFLYDSSF